jgi:hypothetical protein
MPALLLFGETERSAAMRHEVPVATGDPFLFAEVDGRRVALTTILERDRIAAAAPEIELLDIFAFGLKELIVEAGRFEAAGDRTQRTGPGADPTEGFRFALGHGVGLEVHEAPGLGLSGTSPLVPGDVVAIEPGLWDRRIGGVRYEDLLLVTATGCETLTDFPDDLAPRTPSSRR